MAAVAPIPRYAPEYSKPIAKWVYNAASAARHFFGDVAGAMQSYPGDRWDIHDVTAYEGLRKCDFNRTEGNCLHGDTFGPFATGDCCEMANCTDIAWACPSPDDPVASCSSGSDRVLYGGGALGVLGSVVARTNDSHVLRIDVLATDVYAAPSEPMLLHYNPNKDKAVWVRVESPQCLAGTPRDVVDASSGIVLQESADCAGSKLGGNAAHTSNRAVASVMLPPDTAVLVLLRPSH
jgi:hypothetical protein